MALMNLISDRKRDSEVENNPVYTVGKGKGGMN